MDLSSILISMSNPFCHEYAKCKRKHREQVVQRAHPVSFHQMLAHQHNISGLCIRFNNIFATQYAIVNVADLEAAFNAGDVVDTEALKAKGLVKKTLDGVKVLGNGELTKALTVKAAAYSASAKEKIEKAGGKAEVM